MRGLALAAPAGPAGGLAAWAAGALAASGLAGDGLYVATASAGGAEAVEFYRQGLAAGLAFANPRLFPWSLATSPTGAIAQALGIRGPTHTLLGGADAVAEALAQAAEDLGAGRAAAGVVVAVDADGAGRWSLAATTLGPGDPVPAVPAGTAVEALARLVVTLA